MRDLRGWLRHRPRLLLAVLLAFGIQIAPPPSSVVSHTHADGGVAHTHAGRIIGGAAVRSGDCEGDGLGTAPGRNLHEHGVQPLAGLAAPSGPPPGPALAASTVVGRPVLGVRTAADRSTRARGPPAPVV